MALDLVVTEDQIFDVLGDFLASIVTVADAAIVQGQGNRVPEPQQDDYIIMIPMRRERISTNVDSFHDDAYEGTIAGTVLTVSKILAGAVAQGQTPGAYPALAASTRVGAQLTGPVGGIGTYSIAPSQVVTPARILQAGKGSFMQPTKLTIQLEVHGPASADNAQIISTMMRDDFGYEAFVALNLDAGLEGNSITPLYADDPRQLPFNNDQQQVENRWVIECAVQANITVQAPQQFADEVEIGLINVDAEYPPS